jgi:membrane-associated protease RseP (regulator of RpoE activity)
VEEILNYLKTKMTIEDISGSLTITRVSGLLHEPRSNTIKDIKEYFSHTEYTPLFDEAGKKHIIKIGVFKKAVDQPKYWLNILLFMATLLSTIFAGSLNSGGNPFKNFSDLWLGIPFSFSIMAILTCHELGHYFVSRKAGMVTTLPYFIPVPFHFIGTFGAVIRMKSIIPDRRSLLKVGMAGPVAGFLVALPITIIGIALSEFRPAVQDVEFLKLGDSLLFYGLAKFIHPITPQGFDLFLHPIAFAGWLGFLVTSMNLIPIGQLDGGHIFYSIFTKKTRFLLYPILGAMVALAFLWPGWILWALLAFFFARRNAVIQDAVTPLTVQEKALAIIPLIVFILTFIPQPFILW